MVRNSLSAFSPPRRRWWHAAVLVPALAVLLAGAEWGVRWLRGRSVLPTHGAEWIWMAGDWADRSAPVAFYAACDFELREMPAEARLQILADEEYWLFVNGRPVGASGYRSGAPLDVYLVADLLRPGGNRLVAELRSRRGAGGFLAGVETSGGRLHCPSGSEWRIFRSRTPGLLRGWAPLAHGDRPLSWGAAPTGRWGAPAAGAPRQRVDALLRQARPLAPRRLEKRGSADEASSVTLVDWGEEIAGFLDLSFADRGDGDGAAAVIYLDRDPPAAELRGADVFAVTPSGEGHWRDTAARRFRFALVAATQPLEGAAIVPVTAAREAELAPPAPEAGVLGLETPLLGAPVQDEVRRQLERLARLTGREKS